jgi:hypothetical protein
LVKAANWLNHLEADLASPLWSHWIRALTAIRSVWRYDERGNGLSDWNAPLNFEAFVDDLESVVDAAGSIGSICLASARARPSPSPTLSGIPNASEDAPVGRLCRWLDTSQRSGRDQTSRSHA